LSKQGKERKRKKVALADDCDDDRQPRTRSNGTAEVAEATLERGEEGKEGEKKLSPELAAKRNRKGRRRERKLTSFNTRVSFLNFSALHTPKSFISRRREECEGLSASGSESWP